MSRIHPARADRRSKTTLLARVDEGREESTTTTTTTTITPPSPTKLTVWKRSSMTFQGTDGFTVIDRHGRLAFRVDNYSRTKSCSEGGGLVLMDGAGDALLTLRPQMWSLQSQWNAYKGDSPTQPRLFSIRRSSRHLLGSSSAEAEVFLRGDADACRPRCRAPDFTVEGSFERRNCSIRSSSGETVARIVRKRVKNGGGVVLANDVFSLVIMPGFDAETVMGFVIVLDRICQRSFWPILCS